jgi:hypothetical protein
MTLFQATVAFALCLIGDWAWEKPRPKYVKPLYIAFVTVVFLLTW